MTNLFRFRKISNRSFSRKIIDNKTATNSLQFFCAIFTASGTADSALNSIPPNFLSDAGSSDDIEIGFKHCNNILGLKTNIGVDEYSVGIWFFLTVESLFQISISQTITSPRNQRFVVYTLIAHFNWGFTERTHFLGKIADQIGQTNKRIVVIGSKISPIHRG